MTKVKMCGITNLEDAMLSAKFGADALGFNFYQKSPRYILPEDARKIIDELPETILNVGVFVNEELEQVIEIAKTANFDAIQLHGEETPEFAKELKERTGLEIIKAFRVSEDFKPEDVLQYEVDAILLDAYSPKEHGGTGETFDWEIARQVKEIFPKMYLAGGISNENVAKAIWEVRPFALDACSGLEEEKGIKDKTNSINFLCNVNFSNHKDSQTEDLFFLLRLYRYRPNMYLPVKSLTHLCTFIIGYLCAMEYQKLEHKRIYEFFKDFDKFEGITKGMFVHHFYNYASHYLEKCNNNEEKAFDLFYAKFEEFCIQHKEITNE